LSAASFIAVKTSNFAGFGSGATCCILSFSSFFILLETMKPQVLELKEVKASTAIDPSETYSPQQKLFVSRLRQLKERHAKDVESGKALTDEEKLKLVVKFNNPLSLANLGIPSFFFNFFSLFFFWISI
jgi:hypothetical protein